jgi:hypothetical protein
MPEVPRAMSGWIRSSSAYRNLDHNYGEKKREKNSSVLCKCRKPEM